MTDTAFWDPAQVRQQAALLQQEGGGADEAVWELMPAECAALISAGPRHLPGRNHVRPYSLKHARQQGAILGHLQRLGLLQARGCHLVYRWPIHLGVLQGRWVAYLQVLPPLIAFLCTQYYVWPFCIIPCTMRCYTFVWTGAMLLFPRGGWHAVDPLLRVLVGRRTAARLPSWSLGPARGTWRACWQRRSLSRASRWWTAAASAAPPTGASLPR